MTSTLYSLFFLAIYATSTSGLLQDEYVPKIKKADITFARVEEQLAKARSKISKAIVEKRIASTEKNGSYIPERMTIYNNPFAFFQSHTEMIKTFKIWTYKEGDIPLMHNGPMKYIYSIEGDFIEEMERKENPLVANHPDEAHAFFIPISITNIVYYLYTPSENIGFIERIQTIVEDYIGVIAEKYPYWNRSKGADHFFVSCHDWAPFVSRGNPKLFKNFIRVLCNANSSEGFIPRQDVSMTEINAPLDNIPKTSTGQSPYNRSILAFFAGGNHGVVRQKLFQHWGNNSDHDIQVYNHLPKDKNYTELLSQSKYCLCPSGYEVASSRATEAIYTGCIPEWWVYDGRVTATRERRDESCVGDEICAMAARGGRNNIVSRRVIDDLIDISGERSPPKYLKIFIEQQITDHCRFIARMHDEIRTSTNLISQLNVLIAELEASGDYEEVFDLVMELWDDRRDEQDKVADFNRLIDVAEEKIHGKEIDLEMLEAEGNDG
ncbi:exostosin-like protein [Tanacetum coccineum]|uniref:Exostosin-like protein n=1 Tax=Tanacetum coccineum TaxID=301880 RepID=A0ABQ5ECS0_9ASTR